MAGAARRSSPLVFLRLRGRASEMQPRRDRRNLREQPEWLVETT